MKIDTLKQLLTCLLLLLLQVLVLNGVQLFGCATPLLYVYFIITFPRGYPRWALLLWGFALGLCNDMFTNTPGVAAAALTLTALIQPTVLELCLPREAEKELKTSAATLGRGKFALLSAVLTVVFCTAFYTIETFHFANFSYWLSCVGGSALLTWAIVVALALVKSDK